MFLVAQACPTLCESMDCSPPSSSVPGDSPCMNIGVGCHVLFQGIFPAQGSNPGLPHWKQILYHLSYHRSPRTLELVAYPLPRGSFQPRNRTRVSWIAGRFFTSWATREFINQLYFKKNKYKQRLIGNNFIISYCNVQIDNIIEHWYNLEKGNPQKKGNRIEVSTYWNFQIQYNNTEVALEDIRIFRIGWVGNKPDIWDPYRWVNSTCIFDSARHFDWPMPCVQGVYLSSLTWRPTCSPVC